MPKNHRSFFERLTGSVSADEEEEREIIRSEISPPSRDKNKDKNRDRDREKNKSRNGDEEDQVISAKSDWMAEEEEEGQLAVDVFHSPTDIVIQAVVAGVKPEDIDVSITQDMVTIRGRRQKHQEFSGEDYYYQELYWGAFSRSIMLPQEVDAEEAEATMKNGFLTIKLPKLDKNRVQKLKVKNE